MEMFKQMTELKLQFVYPENLILRRSYQGLIKIVLEQQRVIFSPVALSKAILEYNDWIDDSNITNPDRPEGPFYKKAKNILKTFENQFTKFNRNGLEVFVFKADTKKRVGSYSELKQLCSLDPYMSEIIATSEKLDLSQPWEDKYSVKNENYVLNSIESEIAKIDSAILQQKAEIVEHNKSCHRRAGSYHLSSDEYTKEFDGDVNAV